MHLCYHHGKNKTNISYFWICINNSQTIKLLNIVEKILQFCFVSTSQGLKDMTMYFQETFGSHSLGLAIIYVLRRVKLYSPCLALLNAVAHRHTSINFEFLFPFTCRVQALRKVPRFILDFQPMKALTK